MNSHRKSRIGVYRMASAAAAILALGASAACSNPLGTDTKRFIIAVDSISAPDVISPSDTLIAVFLGRIGPDGCSGLDRVERSRSADVLELRFHGQRKQDWNVYCTQMPERLDHVERVPPLMEDPFMIRVIQPDGSKLEKVVRVRRPPSY